MSPIMSGIAAVAGKSVTLVNLFPNSSFENATGNTISRGARNFGAAHTGSSFVVSDYASTTDYYDSETSAYLYSYYNDNHITVSGGTAVIGQRYSISFWYWNANGTANFFGSSISVSIGSGWTYYKIENVLATGTTFTLDISLGTSFNQPVDAHLDDIWVVAGATAH
jgi:hypothetical protein